VRAVRFPNERTNEIKCSIESFNSFEGRSRRRDRHSRPGSPTPRKNTHGPPKPSPNTIGTSKNGTPTATPSHPPPSRPNHHGPDPYSRNQPRGTQNHPEYMIHKKLKAGSTWAWFVPTVAEIGPLQIPRKLISDARTAPPNAKPASPPSPQPRPQSKGVQQDERRNHPHHRQRRPQHHRHSRRRRRRQRRRDQRTLTTSLQSNV